MKSSRASFLLALAAILPAAAGAASDHGGHGAMPSHSTVAAAAKMVDGQVKKIDKGAGKVTLSHGPLVNLGMDMPMTMVFRVKDPGWLEQMKEGDKIRFLADNVNGAITVVQFERAR